MYNDQRTYDEAIKFQVLSTWLKNRLEDDKFIHSEDIKEMLISMGLEVNEKARCCGSEVE